MSQDYTCAFPLRMAKRNAPGLLYISLKHFLFIPCLVRGLCGDEVRGNLPETEDIRLLDICNRTEGIDIRWL